MTTISRYTPSTMPGEQLERLFVARERILARLVERVEALGTTPSPHHTLLVGPRGAGKTHLIALVAHRARRLTEGGQRMRIAWLPEDPWTIASYGRLLAAILDAAGEESDSHLSEDQLDAQLRASLRTNGPVLLLMENVDQVLNAIGDLGQQRLRNLFQTESGILLIGSTTTLDRTLADEAFPFFDFFDTIRLEPFSAQEAQDMLRALAHEGGDSALEERLEEADAVARIHTISHLAGGQPRLWALLGSVLTVDQVDNITDLLLTRFDDLTPYYQERLARLSPQQRLVVAELATADRPLPVKAIAERVGADQRSVAKSVSDLVDQGWLAAVSTPFAHMLDRRRTYYELAEPLARLAFQIKESRGEPLKLIIEFLVNWFDAEELHASGRNEYARAALEMIDQDETLSLVRGLTSLPAVRRPSLALLDRVEDALAALAGGDAEPVMSLPSTLRQAIELRYGEEDGITDMRLMLLERALTEVGNVPQVESQTAWLARAERLDAEAQSLQSRLMHVRWLAAGWRLDEAAAALSTIPEGNEHVDGQEALADAYRASGRAIEAVALYEQVVQVRLQLLGPDHPDTLASRSELAYVYLATGRTTKAVDLYEQVPEDYRRVLGPDHSLTLTSSSNLAAAYESAGRVADAIKLYEQVLEDRLRVLGSDHPDTLTSRSNLAFAYKSAGRVEEAIRLYEEVLEECLRVLGPDHPDTLISRSNLAVAYWTVGKVNEAIALFEYVLEDSVRVVGPGHLQTLTSRGNLAYAYRSAGRLSDSIDLYERVLKDSLRVLGPEHPQTLTIRENLTAAYREVGRPEEAEKLLEQWPSGS
ncbi:tetratricopeptide repeat protein [Actinomyces sp. 594]|uniref:tetratricopeptide repeat protein n=1 Tax=Actinomyces sp. 594 TaxID=2057793 RepID=UPI001C57F5C3|nr:tetratricopeptide repeat protein [Actinomyces sp. 594]MBW3069869.1 tetratricopeptide repeat protein [Actinomyces sp. 594]